MIDEADRNARIVINDMHEEQDWWRSGGSVFACVCLRVSPDLPDPSVIELAPNQAVTRRKPGVVGINGGRVASNQKEEGHASQTTHDERHCDVST
jgi:hypothetical protein